MRTRLLCLLAAGAAATATPAPAQTSPQAVDTSWVARSALYEVFVQDFSPEGNFRGVIEGLDRIRATGTNVVWLMPVHPIGVLGRKGTLGSPYAAKDYRAFNPAYGTEKDFRALVQAVHAKKMRLILDWVPDHTSLDHPWVKAHPDFYIRDERGQPLPPRDPDGKLTDWTDVAQLDYANPKLRQEMIATMRWWLQRFGIDGFRVDVAGFLPKDFWREAVPEIRAAVPRRILLLAEWDDPEMHQLGFDLTYGWDSYQRAKAVWGGAKASTFIEEELAAMQARPANVNRMRFTTNHDETAWDNPPVAIFGGSAGARAAFVAVALLPGRPLLYNGQEVESPQKLGLFELQAIEWKQPNADSTRSFYRRVIDLARTDSFAASDLRPVETTAPDDVIAYRRGRHLVLVNVRTRPVQVTVKDVDIILSSDILSGRTHMSNTVPLPAHGAAVLPVVLSSDFRESSSSLRREAGLSVRPELHGVEVEWVDLGFGGLP